MNQQKVITRHVWQDYVDEAQHLRKVNTIKGAYKRRKETIERVYADGKEKHGLRYTQLRGITNVITEITLKYAAMNLKKLGKLKWIWA
ncbi:transposase [Petrocella sp. FN5]|uniref:transposase n=1 Tax=Petrocella sp. FN5 TaxID=3032002 RepID=UPI0023DC8D07|nr:transposase [Petrocella sp. FN5]MDF1618810.1 transposase [Petrocella sp. FN5]